MKDMAVRHEERCAGVGRRLLAKADDGPATDRFRRGRAAPTIFFHPESK